MGAGKVAAAAVVVVVGFYTATGMAALHGGGSPAANRVLADRMAAHDGWTGRQRACLNTLWRGESGFSQYADTRVTGLDASDAAVFAYGIPQARPAAKLPLAGRPADLGGDSNAATQIRWGLGYIEHTYGSPCAALAAKRANGNRGY